MLLTGFNWIFCKILGHCSYIQYHGQSFRPILILFWEISKYRLKKAYILAYVLACGSYDLVLQKCANVFWMGFTLTNSLHFVSLAKCPFCNIYLESTYDTNQSFLKIYLLTIFLKQILNTFLKRYFFGVKIKLWPNISIRMFKDIVLTH